MSGQGYDFPPSSSGGGGSFYQTFEDEGTPVTQRANANFVGAGVTVTDAGGKTVVTIPGGGSTPTGTGFTHITAGVQDAAAKLVDTADINNDQVTYAKMQNVSAADRLLGRGNGGGAGDTQEITLGTNLSLSGTTLNASGGGTPAGADKQVQYNDGGAFGAEAGFEYDKAIDELTVPGITISQDIKATGVITPSQITSDQNDYAPTGHATASTFRISTDKVRTITGLAGPASGRIVMIENVGLYPIQFADNSSASSAANRFSNDPTGPFWLLPAQMVFYVYDGTLSLWEQTSVPSSLFIPIPFAGYRYFNDFEAATGLAPSVSGAGASNQIDTADYDTALGNELAFYCLESDTGTTTTGRGGMTIAAGANAIEWLGAGRVIFLARVRFPALSIVAEEYNYCFGFANQLSTGTFPPTSGCWFQYDRITDGDFWAVCTGATKTVTSFAVNTNFVWLMAMAKSDNSEVIFYGKRSATDAWTVLATHTTNIPAAGAALGAGFKITKTAGTTPLAVRHDLMAVSIDRVR